MRPVVPLLLCSACLTENPAYSSAGEAAGPADGTGAASTSSDATTSAPTTSGSTSGSVGGTTTGSVDESTGPASTTGPAFEPMTLKAYESGACTQGIYCANMMGDAFPAEIRAFECFHVDVAPPFVLTRIGFEVRLIVGKPNAIMTVLPFDADVGTPNLEPIATQVLGPIEQPMVYRSFDVGPIVVDVPDFCVVVSGGDAMTSLSLRTDPNTMAPGDAFFTMDNPSNVCDEPLTNLKGWYEVPFAHYCIDVDIAPPP